ncbi:GCN5-related N-acetyltransferase [Gloeothece citriformis PCC 7424]|uniref:GCN5-related N-acetyltransferase n=1 Tax=Gloeothece citriformis (strain PCC 7424) TaxID=65393 RepID=B7KD30_GLOC7|nr:GNAT family N-acetyltransferase [Gloeothece citriformis]ACK73151.1 GCN5-related N-acetyltransferase [Gloeothece citriformis PCC 7424]
MNKTLPDGCVLRSAQKEDMGRIRQLVFSAMLDPTQLNWSQFWVIEYERRIIACGQLRNFDGAQELGSLVVVKDWRDRGIGSYLVQHLMNIATKPLYLECLGTRRVEFYSRFGFVRVSWDELPPSLKSKFTLSAIAHKILRVPIYFMYHPLPLMGKS